MDFEFTPAHKAFRARVRRVIEDNLPSDWPVVSSAYDNGSDGTVAFAKTFCPILAEEGLLVPHWPVEYGGQGLDAYYHWILNEEMWAAGEPRAYQYMNVNWVGPALIKFGTEDQKREHLAKIKAGAVTYCQGFSEPGAGSDLASLKTRAEKTAGGYLVNGQKIWTSAASFADYCFLLVRTSGERRQGITVLIVPLDTPGVTVRIIPGLQGKRAIHEVFFDDVLIPESARLGPEDEGWGVTMQILANERIGIPRYALSWRGFNQAVTILREQGRLTEAVIARSARCEAGLRAARLMALSVIDDRVKGRPTGPKTSVARYAAITAERTVCDFLADCAPDLIFPEEHPVIAAAYKRAASIGIAAGAAEIQLNLISRDLLQMPKS